jgi:hypothetical protein
MMDKIILQNPKLRSIARSKATRQPKSKIILTSPSKQYCQTTSFEPYLNFILFVIFLAIAEGARCIFPISTIHWYSNRFSIVFGSVPKTPLSGKFKILIATTSYRCGHYSKLRSIARSKATWQPKSKIAQHCEKQSDAAT